jgi:hypothetical protein
MLMAARFEQAGSKQTIDVAWSDDYPYQVRLGILSRTRLQRRALATVPPWLHCLSIVVPSSQPILLD